MAELLFFREGELQMRAPLRETRIVLGRSQEADLVLPMSDISRRQCAVVEREGGHLLVDLSGRGTLLSNRVADEDGTPLVKGDEIRIGPFLITYETGNNALPEATTLSPSPSLEVQRLRRGDTALLPTSSTPASSNARSISHPPRLRLAMNKEEVLAHLKRTEGFQIVIGNAPPSPTDVHLNDRHVSAAHCRLIRKDDRWLLEDLESTNGTWVDGLRVFSCIVSAGSTIRVGETALVLEEPVPQTQRTEMLPGMVSRDPMMLPAIHLIQQVAPTRAAVSIHGETGTGKEVVARAIHLLSERRDAPFVALNCGAISRNTVESELFGHEKGAFTGADKSRSGAFEEADQGTLFLDEVGDLPLDIQVKLLRVLERGELRRLGGNRTLSVDVRIVSATHVDLLAAVENGRFREDLYYRLCVVPVELPPLRQRTKDIVPLAERFLFELSPDHPPSLDDEAQRLLECHGWPGNARELRNVIQTALLLRKGPLITASDIRFPPAPRIGKRSSTSRHDPFAGRTLLELEQEAIVRAIERHGGDRRKAMKELGMPRSTFFRRLEAIGLTRSGD